MSKEDLEPLELVVGCSLTDCSLFVILMQCLKFGWLTDKLKEIGADSTVDRVKKSVRK